MSQTDRSSTKNGKIPHGEWDNIYQRFLENESFASIARSYDCSPPNIRYIVKRIEQNDDRTEKAPSAKSNPVETSQKAARPNERTPAPRKTASPAVAAAGKAAVVPSVAKGSVAAPATPGTKLRLSVAPSAQPTVAPPAAAPPAAAGEHQGSASLDEMLIGALDTIEAEASAMIAYRQQLIELDRAGRLTTTVLNEFLDHVRVLMRGCARAQMSIDKLNTLGARGDADRFSPGLETPGRHFGR